MTFIPSNRLKKAGLDAARVAIKDALRPYLFGKTADKRLEDATADVLSSIEHMISSDAKKAPLGATIMTESASMNKKNAPRNI